MDVALYILNEKQVHLAKLRLEWGLKVNIEIDTDLVHTDVQIVRTVHADEVDFVAPVRPEPIAFDTTPDVAEDEEVDDEIIESDDDEEDDGEKRPERAERAERPEREEREGRNGKRRRRRRGGRDRDGEERPAVAANPEASESEDDGEDDDSIGEDGFRKGRRRRGRRGGRRAGFDSRPRETYSWVRARTPSLEAPYVWIDPFEEQQRREQSEDRPQRNPAPVSAESALGAESTQPTSLVPEALRDQPSPKRQRPPRRSRRGESVAEAPVDEAAAANNAAPMPLTKDVYTDPEAAFAASEPPHLPVEDVAPPVRKTRSRKKVVEAEAEAPAAVEAPVTEEPVAEVLAEPVKPARASRSRAKKVPEAVTVAEPVITETVAVAAPEPVVAAPVVAAPVISAEPDPNEISAPPEKPKRGWWRR
jgi:ribonuclease E